jgi:hypothetical protein
MKVSWLFPCPMCRRDAIAADGHAICLRCEGVKAPTIEDTVSTGRDRPSEGER